MGLAPSQVLFSGKTAVMTKATNTAFAGQTASALVGEIKSNPTAFPPPKCTVVGNVVKRKCGTLPFGSASKGGVVFSAFGVEKNKKIASKFEQ